MKKVETLWAELGVGRTGPVQCCYILAKNKPDLTNVPAGYKESMQSVTLDPRLSLVEQAKKLRHTPSLVIMKCHKSVMDKAGQDVMRNIKHFMASAGDSYTATRLIPFQVQCDLADRFSMISLLEDVCVAANRFDLGNHAVPLARNVESNASPKEKGGAIPPGLLPAVVKPRDSSRHDLMFVVFDRVGLAHVGKKLQEYRIEQLVNHGGWVYKVYVIGDEIQVVRRPSLADMSVHTRADLDSAAEQNECLAVHVADSPHGGYLNFNSAKLTKGRKTGLPSCQSLADSDLDPRRVRLLSDLMQQRLGCALFGFDILHNADTDSYFVVDVNIFPGYKGFLNFYPNYHNYLRDQARIKAVGIDSEKLLDRETIKRICVSAVPKLSADKHGGLQITHIKSHNNNIFRVGLVGGKSKAMSSDEAVIYRIGGRRFQEQALIEMELVEYLGRRGLGAGIIMRIAPVYFGGQMLLGRIEQCLPGRSLGEYALGGDGLPTRFYCAATALVGKRLAGFHLLAADPAFQAGYLKRHYSNWQESILWTRVDAWKRQAQAYAERVAPLLAKNPLWAPLFADLESVIADLPSVVSRVSARLRCDHSRKIVFAHFDLTPNNILVSSKHSNSVELIQFPSVAAPVPEDVRVELVDFEWSGPCQAVYDFAKFVLSSQMSILRSIPHGPERLNRLRNSPTQDIVSRGLESMVHTYKQTMAESGVDIGEEKDFVADTKDFICIAAAVNIFSNIIHAGSEMLLEPGNLPTTNNLRLGPHNFNWLQHAANHCLLYNLNMAQDTNCVDTSYDLKESTKPTVPLTAAL